ncbi:putative myb and hsa domain protein [Erysiphe neolycopersici]|uniref:Vacuolar import and degradation protein 21 n=1 Tax=Erysiphe neolycopersici TaxID=212602 RepID=A0A420HT62_9PEZI|nr:putative myb and hsa domain protein [Erysiphe neolycopersici]
MSEVGATDRSRLLQSKRAELSGIVKSRKRKLREFFAVCDNGSTIPQLDISNPDTPPINPAEAHFLDVTDILQDRLFDESNLPTRRQIRIESFENNVYTEKQSISSSQLKNASRRVSKLLCSDTSLEKSKAIVLGPRNNVNTNTSSLKFQVKDYNIERILLQAHGSNSPHAILPEDQKEGSRVPSPGTTDSTVQLKKGTKNIENSIDNENGITSTSNQDLIKASKIDVDHLPEVLQIQTSYVHKLDDNETSPLSTILPQNKYTQENGSVQCPDEGTNRILQTGSSSLDRSKEKNALICKHQEKSCAKTSTTHLKSTDSSAYLENHLDKNKICPMKNGIAKLPKSEITHKELLQNEANNQISRDGMNIFSGVADNESNHIHDRETNRQAKASVIDELDNLSDNLHTKEINDSAQYVMERGENLANNLRLKSTANLGQNVQNVAMRVKKKKNQRNLPTEIEGQLSSDSNELTNMANSEALQESSKLIDAPVISSSTSSGNSQMTKGPPKLNFDPKLQLIIPVVPSKPIMMHPPSERRNTRIGSGVLERKNVSDIFGDAILTSGSSSKSPSKFDLDTAKNSHLASQTTNPQRPATRVRILTQKQKENENRKLSNVIFANKSVKEDYFLPLFLANASTGKGYLPALENLLTTAHKTLTTSNAYVPIHESQTARILKRIYNLQSSHKWSLRQPKRSIEPIRPRTHWDILLHEVLWMRTDFKEERKWKKSVAASMAYACAEWVSSSQRGRKALQVKVAPLHHIAALEDIQNSKDIDQAILSTSDLNESREAKLCLDDSEQPQISLLETVAPTDIFGLLDNDVVFSMGRSHVVDKLLSELPMYGNPLHILNSEQQISDFDPDRIWKRPALPLSKYVEGKIRLRLNSPPRKKSRFEYDEEDDESQNESSGKRTKQEPLPPESTDIALFDLKNRHILERIRNVNCFRPPSEFQMPSQSFFECRTASQWTWDEDKELKVLVRDYTYNWSLISSILTSKSKSDLATGAERRTPWECFERWIELEGLPGDMQKTYYFRLYTSRIENANKTNLASQSAQNLQGQIQQTRKKSTTSVRVERRRNQKHLILIDTMRKLAKKREITIQKQQHAANIAAMRKVQEVPHITNRDLSATTPQYFSRLRHEHEFRKERTMQSQSRQDMQRRSVLAQRNSGLNIQHQSSLLNAIRPFPPGLSIGPNSSNLANPNRAHQPSPPISNLPLSSSGARVASIGLSFVPQAPMQGQISAPNSSLDAGLVSRAHAISQHQQAILRQQQQQQNQVIGQPAHSSPRINGVSSSNYSMQGNLIPPFSSNLNGVTTPSSSSLSPLSQADSCRNTQPPQPFTPIQRMEIQFKAKYPSATPDQIANMISHAVSQSMQQQHQQRQNIAQNALNVAAGGPVASMNNMNKSQTTPQMYAQMLRQQQENRLL